MRIAAGILMILYGVKAIGFLVSSLSAGFIDYRFPWGLIVIIPAVFLSLVGSFALRGNIGKYASLQALSSCFL